MNFQLPICFEPLTPRIQHQHKIELIGSCFTEHMSNFLNRTKFKTLQNSHGILFNPLSVCRALEDIIEKKIYTTDNLFFLNEYWHSWFHHSDFSNLDQHKTLEKINSNIELHHQFLKQADYIFITLGSAFAYYHVEQNMYVSNNHRAPSHWFEKRLLQIDYIVKALENIQEKLLQFNPTLKVMYTISPVRHSRDGVIENNRSKARLIEAVHSLKNCYYFPAYEFVIDILRDYRFYDIDFVHPNYQATAFVWEQFVEHCIDPTCIPLMKQLEQLYKAKHHKAKSTESEAHKKFMNEQFELCMKLKKSFPYLDLAEEFDAFTLK